MFVVSWKSGESKGYDDLLPSGWFARDGDWAFLSHDVRGPRGRRSTARCSLSVRGNIADIGYAGEHAAYNERMSFFLGTTRLIFSDSSRSSVDEVQWQEPERGADFEPTDAECPERSMPFDELESFNPLDLEDGRQRIQKMAVLRQGQPAFRNALMDAYEGRCAITGCTIQDVLEAAHISPYLGEHTNHVTNGLLLRADIHTLFDRGLLKVDRDYRITAEAHVRDAYDLPETLTPPSDPALHPNRQALDLKCRE